MDVTLLFLAGLRSFFCLTSARLDFYCNVLLILDSTFNVFFCSDWTGLNLIVFAGALLFFCLMGTRINFLWCFVGTGLDFTLNQVFLASAGALLYFCLVGSRLDSTFIVLFCW